MLSRCARAIGPVVALLALGTAGCGKKGLMGVPYANQRPTIELTQVPAPGDTAGTYAYEISWAGFDADGKIARYAYAVDPPGLAAAETSWVHTTANRHTFTFRSDSIGSGAATRARRYHTVAVKCVDDLGSWSAVAAASFTTTTVAPTAFITLPLPNKLLSRQVSPALRIEWRGDDPDGIGSTQPLSYRWRLFNQSSEFRATDALAAPDSLRRFYAPEFAGWDSVGGDVRAASLRDLLPGQQYLFVVVAFDQAGAYSPLFSADGNMLQFQVDRQASLGPRITINAPSFTYTFPSGGFLSNPEDYLNADFAADVPLELSWSATAAPGGFIRGYRWAVDISRLDDETERTDETSDLRHWSRLSPETGVVLPAYSPAAGRLTESHFFYLEAEDEFGIRSLGVLEFTVVRASFDRDLLIVDDTWFAPDVRGTGSCVGPPRQNWPSAAELDTFLYAAGDKPYQCYPTGTLSPAGVFAGYAFDTLCTHFSPPSALNLRRLDHYRNIIWMCDLTSAFTYTSHSLTSFLPEPLLREWCTTGATNPLATWLLQGGRLWLMGGGSAMASLIPYDKAKSANNIFSSTLGELGPGRLMYDGAHWRSEIRVLRSIQAQRSARAVGGWAGAPDYTALPAVLMGKTPETDPMPPLRTSNFYLSSYYAEHLFKPNAIIEGTDLDPERNRPFSALDTLYETLGGETGVGWPVMTVYHGTESPLLVFSGFPLWYFQRGQVIELLDFVLGRMWGLTRRPVLR